MTLSEEIKASVSGIFSQSWDIRQGRTVPDDRDVSMTGKVVRLEGTVLYADMKESSKLVEEAGQRIAGRVYQAFLKSSARIITEHGGVITAYDGDRIMAIFMGGNKNSSAAITALKINYVVEDILRPTIQNHFRSLGESGFEISHCVGIDFSNFLSVKAGQREANDIVWIGRAPNLAAYLSEIRDGNFNTYISKDVFQVLNDEAKYSDKKVLMWQEGTLNYLGESISVNKSAWTWVV